MDQPERAGTLTSEVKDLDGILTHYGIKGMKWGVRRANPSAPTHASEDHKNATALKTQVKTGGTKSLSNKDLKDYLERMDLEKRYNKANPTPSKKAGKFIAETLLNIGKQEAAKFAAKQVAAALAGR